mmetsp:Transcript_89805/g.187698  ORF Transcript_89805/g.187698 Transcript_89805/m.187698 type:complete len:678 (-) Transcript_89805:149-2182(-)
MGRSRSRSRSAESQRSDRDCQTATVCSSQSKLEKTTIATITAPSIIADWRGRFRRFPGHRFNVLPRAREGTLKRRRHQEQGELASFDSKTMIVPPLSGLVVGLVPVSGRLSTSTGKQQLHQCVVFDSSTKSFTQGDIAVLKDRLRGNLRPSILACKVRGVDILRWILVEGASDLALSMVVHDIPLMRNLLEGVPPTQQQDSGLSEPRRQAFMNKATMQAAFQEAEALWGQLAKDAGRLRVYALNLGAQLSVAALKVNGIPFCSSGLDRRMTENREELAKVEKEAKRLITKQNVSTVGLNLQSSAQVGRLIAQQLDEEEQRAWPRTAGGALSTDSAVLSQSSLPFARCIVRYREILHEISHLEPCGIAAREGNGRLFPIYHLSGAVTGRMSCTNPNLHSLPRCAAIRSLVKSSAGGLLVKGDFSQVELRVLAEVSGDERMKSAFTSGQDLHRVTAAALLGTVPEDVSPEERQLAKAVNFGLIYGQSAAGLRRYAETKYGVILTQEEAQVARRNFFRTYQGVDAWQKEQRRRATEGAPIRTPGGRLACHLQKEFAQIKGEHLAGLQQGAARLQQQLGRVEREALNFPIQGGAAEVMLATLDCLRQSVVPCACRRLIAIVHDEFLFECQDRGSAQILAAALRTAMQGGWHRLFPGSPFDPKEAASIAIGEDWAHLTSIDE